MNRLLLSRSFLLVALTATAVSLPAQLSAVQLDRPQAVAVLEAKTDLKVQNLPLTEFARLLAQKYRIPVRLDDAGLKRSKVAPTTPISANLEGVPLGQALTHILGRLKLAPRVFNGIVLITDREPPGAPAFRPRPVVPRVRRVQDPFAAQNAPDQGLEWRPMVTVELLFVKKACAPTKAQLREMEKDLAQCLERAVTGTTDASCDAVPNELVECVTKHLSPADADRYHREVVKRRGNEREACVWTFVTFIDQDLALTETQRRVMVARLVPKWEPAWSQMIELAVRDGGREVPPVPDSLIVPLLDREQAKRWGEVLKCRDPHPRFNAGRIGSVGTPIDEPDDGD